jgi:DNA-binding response OmpR family regulator
MQEARKVLIVDDDENLCYLLCAGLRLKGWIPESVGNFGSALVAVRSGFDVVLLDPGLPDSPPMATIRDSRRLREGGGRRIYILTGAPIDDKMKAICAECGADGLISKNATDFVAGLRKIIEG